MALPINCCRNFGFWCYSLTWNDLYDMISDIISNMLLEWPQRSYIKHKMISEIIFWMLHGHILPFNAIHTYINRPLGLCTHFLQHLCAASASNVFLTVFNSLAWNSLKQFLTVFNLGFFFKPTFYFYTDRTHNNLVHVCHLKQKTTVGVDRAIGA